MAYEGTLDVANLATEIGKVEEKTKNLDKLVSGLKTFETLKKGFETVADAVGKAVTRYDELSGSSEGIGTAWSGLQSAVLDGAAGIVGAIDEGLAQTRFESISNAITTMKDVIVAALGLVADAFGFAARNIGPVTAGLAGLTAAVLGVKFINLVQEMGSVTAAAIKMVPAIIATAVAKGKDALASVASCAAYVKETIAKTASTVATNLLTASLYQHTLVAGGATLATSALRLAMMALPYVAIAAAAATFIGALIRYITATKEVNEIHQRELDSIADLREALKEYVDQTEANAAAAESAREKKVAEMNVNRQAAKSLQELVQANDEYGTSNLAIASRVDQLNSSMSGLGLSYDATTGQLNMTSKELSAYMTNLAKVEDYQQKQEEYNRLVEEHSILYNRLMAAKQQEETWAQMRDEGLITEEEYGKLLQDNAAYTEELTAASEDAHRAREAAKVAAEEALNVEAMAAARRQEIINNQMDEVEQYAQIWGKTTDDVLDEASRLGGGLEELAAQQAKQFTKTGQDVGMVATLYGQSAEDIRSWIEQTGGTLDDYVKHAEQNLTKDGLNVEQLAEKWGVSAESIENDMRMNQQSAQQWEESHRAAMNSIREYAVGAGKSYDEIAAEAEAAGMDVDAYVAQQRQSLTSAGMDIEQVADYWDVSVDEIEKHMDDYGVSLDQAHKDMATMRTKSGLTLDELAALLGVLPGEVETAAGAMGLSWQEYGDLQEQEIAAAAQQMEEYATRYGMSAEEVRQQIEAMGGDTEAWLRATQEQEQDRIDGIKAGKEEISAALAGELEERRLNGEALNAVDQAYLDQWKAIVQEEEDLIAGYAETYGLSTEEVRAQIQAMGGDAEEWAEQMDQAYRAVEIADQRHIDQIKAGNVEINAAQAKALEDKYLSGEALNAVDQAYLDQWLSLNQAAADQYKAQQASIVDAAKAKATQINLLDQQSAEDILETQRLNNEATSAYVDNYNTIWGQIPESQRQYLTELDIDSARFLEEMAANWDDSGKEQWEQYVAGIEEGTEIASKLTEAKAEEISDSVVQGSEAGAEEQKQAGADVVDRYSAAMAENPAASEASQTIANSVVTDLTNADYSGITGGIAAAIETGTSQVTTAAQGMADAVLGTVTTMKTDTATAITQMMTDVQTNIVALTPSVNTSATDMGAKITTAATNAKTQTTTTIRDMMININTEILTHTDTIKTTFDSLSAALVTTADRTRTQISDIARQMMADIDSKILESTETIKASFESVGAGIVTAFTNTKDQVSTLAADMMTAVNTAITDKSATIASSMATVGTGITRELTTAKTQTATLAQGMMTEINTAITSQTATIRTSITSVRTAITEALNTAKSQATTSASQMMTDIKSAITERAGAIATAAANVASGITSNLESMVTGAVDAANRMMDGILNAMNTKAESLYTKAREIADTIAQTMSDALEVQSPSRVMIGIFRNVMLGAYEGMAGLEDRLYRLAGDIGGGIAQRLGVAPDAAASMAGQLRLVIEANPFASGYLNAVAAHAGVSGGLTYNTYLTQEITTPKPLSASEMTREAENFLRRSKWQLP